MTKNKIAHQAGSKLPRTSDENGIMYLQKDKKLVNRELFRIVIPHNPSKFRFQTLKNQTAKARSRKVLAAPGTSSYIPVLTCAAAEFMYQDYCLLQLVLHCIPLRGLRAHGIIQETSVAPAKSTSRCGHSLGWIYLTQWTRET